MGRPLRIQYPGAWYHITSRGNEKKPIFKNKGDREKFLSYLNTAYERYGAVIHAYCLMTNHYHLLLETPRSNLSQILHHINGAYTNYFNAKWHRSGHLFQGRYMAIVIEKDSYCEELSRYIHLNPVRAGLADEPSKYPWTSYHCYIGKMKSPSWLKTDNVLGYFDKDLTEAQRLYRRFVEQVLGKKLDSPLKDVFASTFLGSEKFIEYSKEKWIGFKNADVRNIPALRVLQAVPSLEKIGNTVRKIVASESRIYKKLCLFVSQQYGGYSLKEIGSYYGMKESAVSQSNRRLKDNLEKDKDLKKILIKVGEMLNVET
jgi:putative transposase